MRIEAENNQRKNIGKDTKQRKVTEQKKVSEGYGYVLPKSYIHQIVHLSKSDYN
jgi:hypothetical protein